VISRAAESEITPHEEVARVKFCWADLLVPTKELLEGIGWAAVLVPLALAAFHGCHSSGDANSQFDHVIVDNYAAHNHPKVLEWLACPPRFAFHFTPTSASWLNVIEDLFALLSKRRLKWGVFHSLQELKDAIHSFIVDTNANPKPFVWRKDPDKIIAAV